MHFGALRRVQRYGHDARFGHLNEYLGESEELKTINPI